MWFFMYISCFLPLQIDSLIKREHFSEFY